MSRHRRYDHRLKELVRQTGDRSFAEKLNVSRSTIDGWLKSTDREVVSLEAMDLSDVQLQKKLRRLERRVEVLYAILRLLLVVVRLANLRLDGRRLPEGKSKARVLKAIERSASILPLNASLRILSHGSLVG